MININDKLEQNSILLSVLSSEYYSKTVLDMMISLKGKKICYITLNKPSNSLMKHFKSNGVDTKNLFFIDAITSSINKNAELENGILISSPYAFTEMGIAIGEVLKTNSFDLVVFDSLSTLTTYCDESIAIRFISHVMNKIRDKGHKGIFTCLEGDVKTNLIQGSSMNIDEILYFKNEVSSIVDKDNNLKIVGGFAVLLIGVLGVFSFRAANPNNLVGFAISEGLSKPTTAQFASILLLIAVISVLFYRRAILIKAHSLRNVNAPMKISSKSNLRGRFKNKICRWLNG